MPEPVLVDTDISQILIELKNDWELQTGKTLHQAQWEQLLLNLLAYRESLVRITLNEVGKQSLVNFATGAALEELGVLVGVQRLGPAAALTSFKVTLEEVLGFSALIPAGTEIQTASGLVFSTLATLTIPAGQTEGEVTGQCLTLGLVGNGLLAGEVATLTAPLPYVQSVVNTSTTFGGSDPETDNRLRERIKLAPEAFSVAGSRGAYRFHALSAHPDLIDVGVDSPTPGLVRCFPLSRFGLPGSEQIALVQAAVSGEKVRPLTDTVLVQSPDEFFFEIEANISFYGDADIQSAVEGITSALTQFADERRMRLGLDVVPSQIVEVIQSIRGVYQVDLVSPASLSVLAPSQWANCTSIIINQVGVADG